MELPELEARLVPFAREVYGDSAAEVRAVHKMPGHAGFSYGFTVSSGGTEESWFLRLPPPKVKPPTTEPRTIRNPTNSTMVDQS